MLLYVSQSISHRWERESKAQSTSHMEFKHRGHLARIEAHQQGQSPGNTCRALSPEGPHRKFLPTSTPIPANQVTSLLVVVVGFGTSVPLGGKACANRKLTQSSRSEQECSILDLGEGDRKRGKFRSNCYYAFCSHHNKAKRKSSVYFR